MLENVCYKKISIKIPARIHLDVMNIKKMNEGKVGGGGIGIAIRRNVCMSVEVEKTGQDIIESIKPKLVRFYLNLIRQHLNMDTRFHIIFKPSNELKTHSGMGSNALIQMGVIYSINNLLNCPLNDTQMLELLNENYYEEDNGILTNKVFCSGVAHNTMLYGGVCFVSEDGKMIYHKRLPPSVKVGVVRANLDKIFEKNNIDKDELIVKLRKEKDERDGMKNKENIIKNLIRKDLLNNKYKSFVDMMNRFSKEDDSVALSKDYKVNNLEYYKFCEMMENIENTFVRISSNSPYIYIVTNELAKVKEKCKEYGIIINEYQIDNNGIEILERF